MEFRRPVNGPPPGAVPSARPGRLFAQEHRDAPELFPALFAHPQVVPPLDLLVFEPMFERGQLVQELFPAVAQLLGPGSCPLAEYRDW